MRWKWVALAAVAWPGFTGCNIARNAARNIVNEPLTVCTQRSIEHELRSAARDAWRDVRADYPRRAFTAEFHDGFLEGYVDYLDRGGNGSLPAVPPSKYARHKKYYSEEGQCLLKDYFLGFKYGQEIAIATGKRPFYTMPVLLPQERPRPPAFTIDPNVANRVPPPMQVPVPPGVGTRPMQPQTVPTSKLDAPVVSEKPERSRTATPPLPVPLPTDIGTQVNPPPVIEVPAVVVPSRSIPRLPAPPSEVPDLPAHIPTPPVWDELPVVPPVHTPPPVVPPSHPETRQE